MRAPLMNRRRKALPSDSSYERLLAVSQETFAQGDYETACHTLTAALDRARYLQDADALTNVERLASEQLAALSRMTLPGRFAAERGVRQKSLQSLYRSILQQCTTWRDLVDHWRQRRAHSPNAPAPREEADQEVPPAGGQS